MRRETTIEKLAPWIVVFLFVVTPLGVMFELIFFQYIAAIMVFAYLGLLFVGAIFIFAANFFIWREKRRSDTD